MTRPLAYASILVCTGALAAGVAAQGFLPAAAAVGMLGLAWVLATTRGLILVQLASFALTIILATVSLWADVSSWLAFTTVTFSLAAWDLALFERRLQMVNAPADCRQMERAHVRRLALVLGLAALGFVIATRVHLDLTFGAAALLALLSVWGISALVVRLRGTE